ncbi:tail fiber assembly protein [Dryocola sp. BD586]|uniref:tail fiber assembly protein n=1 Tax=Dryocola sp. BD586 TaxID=3133271 RepID=UPI003F50B889
MVKGGRKTQKQSVLQQCLSLKVRKSGSCKRATLTIETLQDAVDLSFATDAEVECLIEWKKYRVPLSRVDINEAQDIQWSSPPVCN